MIVVIQCAGTKRKHAGHLRTNAGKPVMFVADPDTAPTSGACVYARPDDQSGYGGSWRDYLLRYNATPENNPFSLLPASELYERETYRALANQVGIDKTYILSAGWGLIAASFLTPLYDITFSPSAEPWKRRARHDAGRDLSMLSSGASEPIVFLGGKDYLPLFVRLTAHISAPRIIFYNSTKTPHAPGCHLVRFPTTLKTNWHYACASALLKGEIAL